MALKMAKSSEELPEEIIQQIQQRLPVKSLMRFTCVSKWWSSIVADPKFAKSHYLLASQQQTLSRRLLVWNDSSRQFGSLDLDTSSVQNLNFSINLPPAYELYQINLLGSFHGLVFLCASGDHYFLNDFECFGFYVWNPSTGFVRNLPAPSFTSCYQTDILDCGFGYVSANDDYKAVFGASIEGGLIFEVFSFRANSWKRVIKTSFYPSPGGEFASDGDNIDYFISQGTVSNEALHWIQFNESDVEDEDEDFVLVFDLVNDVFRKPIQLPIRKELQGHWTTTLGVGFGGCLSLAVTRNYNFHDQCIELWVMREYNDPESWAKLYTGNHAHQNICDPLFCWESCIFTFKRHSPYLISRFDLQEEKCDDYDIRSSVDVERNMYSSYVIGYDESLLRPHDYQA